MFTQDQIKKANATCRTNGTTAKNNDGTTRAVVPKFVIQHVDKSKPILDYGAGKFAIHTQELRQNGYTVTAYEFGDNVVPGIHDVDALKRTYPVVMASNVINVQSDTNMLIETLTEIYNALSDRGVLITNIPATPRKINYTTDEYINVIQSVFKSKPTILSGGKTAPVLIVTK